MNASNVYNNVNVIRAVGPEDIEVIIPQAERVDAVDPGIVEARTINCFNKFCHCPNSCKKGAVDCAMNECSIFAGIVGCYGAGVAGGCAAAYVNPAYSVVPIVAAVSACYLMDLARDGDADHQNRIRNYLDHCCAIVR